MVTMELILTIATILGGITALWFLYEKIIRNKNRLVSLINIQGLPNTETVQLKLLRKVNVFLNNGDIVSAKTVLMEGQKYEDLHANRMLEIIIIEQKYGQIVSALSHIKIVESKIPKDPITSGYVQLELLKLKVYSQCGDLNYIKNNGEKIINLLVIVHERQKIPSVANRLGVYFSVKNNKDKANYFYNLSLNISREYNLKHTEITTRMFMVTSQSLCNIDFGIINPLKEIISIQEEYINAGLSEENLDLWQTHLLKSVVQTLFCESAILYTDGYRVSAYLRLCAANLLVVPAKANAKAEGYADLLNLVQDKNLKKILISAMSADDEDRERFLASTGASPIFLNHLQNVVKPNYTILEKSVWSEFRNYINEQDDSDKK